MSTFVVAGQIDCQGFAKAELLADSLTLALPNCKVRKHSFSPAEWPEFLRKKCEETGWSHSKSPLIWRETAETSHAGQLIGDEKNFVAYAREWYGYKGDNESLAKENAAANASSAPPPQIAPRDFPKPPISVCITGAAGQIGYNLTQAIASGRVFGNDRQVDLRLQDLPEMEDRLRGLCMEIEDCAYDVCSTAHVTSDPIEAFRDVDYAVLLAAVPRAANTDPVLRVTGRREVLQANAAIFKQHGEALNRVAKPSTKVVVVANPANTNAFIIKTFAPSLPAKNITSLSKLDENRASAQVRQRLREQGSSAEGATVRNMVVWGNHSATVVADASHAFVTGGALAGPSQSTPVPSVLRDDDFLRRQLVREVQGRSKAIVQKRRQTPALSAARAISQHLAVLAKGTPPDRIVSMGVFSEANPFGLAEDVFCSLPVTVSDGQWQFADTGQLDADLKELLQASAQELQKEKLAALQLLGLSATNGHAS